MQLMSRRDGPVHFTDAPDAASVAVLFGGKRDSADVGMVRVTVPAGAGMPSHRHGGSDVIVIGVAGEVRVTKGDQVVNLGAGDALLVLKYESVSLINPHQQAAELLVAVGRAGFTSAVQHWSGAVVSA